MRSGLGAADLTVADLLRNESTYDGQHVVVTGAITSLEEKTSHKGNAYDVFDLCAGSCVHVFIFGRPRIQAGERITIRGTFSVTKRVGSYTFHDEIEADEGSL